MCTLHLRSQLLQRAKLQLLHGSFALSELLCNLPNAPLVDKSPKNYPSLLSRKFSHQLTLPRVFPDRFRRRFTPRHAPSASYNCARRRKVTLLFVDFQPTTPWFSPTPPLRLPRSCRSSSTHERNDRRSR